MSAFRLPELILSWRPLLGVSSISKAVDLDCLVRFARPQGSAGIIASAAERGIAAIAAMNDPMLLRGIELARARAALDVYPVIPNVIGYVREATDHGMVGAGMRLVRRLGVRDLLGVGMRGLASWRGVMARDFATLLSMLIEVEMAAFRSFRPPLVLLHSQVTDIAVAFRNERVLRVFADVIRQRFGAEPGVVTNNFDALLGCLAHSQVDIRVVVAPFNPAGFLMKPTRAVCEARARAAGVTVLADRITGGGTASWSGAFEYLRGLGIGSALVDVVDRAEIDDVIASRAGGEPPLRGPDTAARRSEAGGAAGMAAGHE